MCKFRLLAMVSASVLFGPLAFTSAHGFSSGTSLDCSTSGCHTGTDVVQVQITGPTEVMLNSSHTFTLTISGGPASVGGFFVTADAGDLAVAAVETTTQLLGNAVAHSAVKDFTAGSVSWEFDWTAPDVVGAVDFMAFGVSAIRDFNALNDSTGFINNFRVQVIPVPAGLLLFSSGLAVLGWMRRRSAGLT